MTDNLSAGGARSSAGLRPRPTLTDWTVAVAMVRDDGTERRTFTTIIPATTYTYALLGGNQYGNAINLGSNRAWKFDGEECITAEPHTADPATEGLGDSPAPGDWHKVHPDAYEDAVINAAGAIIGWTSGKGESFRWSEAVHEGFRHAIAEAFNRGVETERSAPLNGGA